MEFHLLILALNLTQFFHSEQINYCYWELHWRFFPLYVTMELLCMLQQNLLGNIYAGPQWNFLFSPKQPDRLMWWQNVEDLPSYFCFQWFLDQHLELLVSPLSQMSAMNIISILLWDDPGSVFPVAAVSIYKNKYSLILLNFLFFTCTLSLNIAKVWRLVIVIFCGFNVLDSKAFRCIDFVQMQSSGDYRNLKISVWGKLSPM